MTPRLQPVAELVQQLGITVPELLLLCASLAHQQPAPAPQAEAPHGPEWLPLEAFAELRHLTLDQAKHLARDPAYRGAFQVVRGRLHGSSSRLDELISSQVSAPASIRQGFEVFDRRRGPISTTAPSQPKRGRRRVL